MGGEERVTRKRSAGGEPAIEGGAKGVEGLLGLSACEER